MPDSSAYQLYLRRHANMYNLSPWPLSESGTRWTSKSCSKDENAMQQFR